MIDRDVERFIAMFQVHKSGDIIGTDRIPAMLLQLAAPRKFTACQFVVATGEMQCFDKDHGPEQMKLQMSEEFQAAIPSLMSVDETVAEKLPEMMAMVMGFASGDVQFPPGTSEVDKDCIMQMGQLMTVEDRMYMGTPVKLGGRVMGALCAFYTELGKDDMDPAQWDTEHTARKALLSTLADEVSAILAEIVHFET